MYVRIVAAAGLLVAAALTSAPVDAGGYAAGPAGSGVMLVADAATTPAPAASATAAPSTAAPKTVAPKAAAPVLPAGVVFPTAIAAKYASQKASLARMHTCLDQYHIDKANKALGGLVWIKKGGGYYSLCNAGLKSAAAKP